MAATLTGYFDRVQTINPRLTIGGGILTLVLAGEGMLAYLRSFG